jgi:CHAD domain-containing protein
MSATLTTESFVCAFENNAENVARRAKQCLESSSPDALHDARTAIRRLRVAYSLLPKKIRAKKKFGSFRKRSDEFFRKSTKIRDLDIVIEKLNGAKNPDLSQLIALFDYKRKKRVKRALEAAESLDALKVPKLRAAKISEQKLEARFERRLREREARLMKKISDLVEERQNSRRAKRAHLVRMQCKKLRYLIEIGPADRDGILKMLTEWQDALGAMQDSRVVRRKLEPFRKKFPLEAILEKEREVGERKLARFLGQWKDIHDIPKILPPLV